MWCPDATRILLPSQYPPSRAYTSHPPRTHNTLATLHRAAGAASAVYVWRAQLLAALAGPKGQPDPRVPAQDGLPPRGGRDAAELPPPRPG
eukprot:1753613-Prymnesium_polylepis.1